jgi:hypothetical protein
MTAISCKSKKVEIMIENVREIDEVEARKPLEQRHSIRATAAVALSVVALGVSGISLTGWAQANDERQQIEHRLVCLEQPGPNDCGQDGK